MSGPHAHQHVDVVSSAVDDQRRSVHFADDAAEISEEIGAKVGLDQRASALRGEDHAEKIIWNRIFPDVWDIVSCAPPGLPSFSVAPTACAVGCILSPLRGCPGAARAIAHQQIRRGCRAFNHLPQNASPNAVMDVTPRPFLDVSAGPDW